MSEKGQQFSPFNMKHGKRHTKKTGKAGVDSKAPRHTTGANKGFGHYGAQSPGGRGKP